MLSDTIERHKDLILIQNIKRRQIIRENLIDKDINQMEYSFSHGVDKNNTLESIFSLTKLIKPKTCLIIGSGCGLIPRIIREAQIDSKADDSKTYLIDLGSSMGAMPNLIHNPKSLFQTLYPEIIIYKGYSYPNGLEFIKSKENGIDILWIDGDHSHKGSKQDFVSYSELVNDNGLIFMHDTAPNGINSQQPNWCGVNKTIEYIKETYNKNYEVLNFTKSNTFDPGAGFAIIKKNLKSTL